MATRLQNPAVVINSETAGVGIIHALSLAGVPMITVERDWPPVLGHHSRFPQLRVFYRPRAGETLTDALLQLADHFDGTAVLFPSTDADLESLIVARDQLGARYHVPAAAHIGLRIFEKNWQYALAERTGVPLPRCVRFAAGDKPNLRAFRFPLIIKPSSRAEAAGDRVFRLRILNDASDLQRTVAEIARDYPGRDFQIAENIPGEPDQLYTIGSYGNREGCVLRSYSGRKITQYPYYHGMASVSESVTLPDTVFEHAQRLLNEARFHGISQVEFKYDPRDQQYKLLEINGRSWLWVKLSAFSGVNLPLIQYYDLTGDPRLADALTTTQDDRRFFVFDHHVKLNNLRAERQRIHELRRQKVMVSAIDHPGDWRLAMVHRVTSLMKRIRNRRSAMSSAGPTPTVSTATPAGAPATRVAEERL